MSIISRIGTSLEPKCPYCQKTDCEHFIGWTEDGKNVELKSDSVFPEVKLLDSDIVVNTGISSRVYRKGK